MSSLHRPAKTHNKTVRGMPVSQGLSCSEKRQYGVYILVGLQRKALKKIYKSRSLHSLVPCSSLTCLSPAVVGFLSKHNVSCHKAPVCLIEGSSNWFKVSSSKCFKKSHCLLKLSMSGYCELQNLPWNLLFVILFQTCFPLEGHRSLELIVFFFFFFYLFPLGCEGVELIWPSCKSNL